MFILPTAADFREWQVWHYQQRLKIATSIQAITFLTDCLTKFLKTSE